MHPARFSRQAHRDLAEIGAYTRARWGEAQAVAYVTALDARCRWLARFPEPGVASDDIRQGYRRFSEGRHVIFYRRGSGGIEIIRVLHQSMLPRRHL